MAERKYLSEHAVNLFTSNFIVVTPSELMSGGEMDENVKNISDNCHIYLICSRPVSSFNDDDFEFKNDKISGSIKYRAKDEEVQTQFEFPFALCDEAIEVKVSEYPHRFIYTYNAGGEQVRHVPAYALSLSGIIQDEALRQLEVLYVGQAYGTGNRSAFDRLKSHSTLQRILADLGQNSPDKEPLILAFEYCPYRIISNMDGTAKGVMAGDEDSKRYFDILENPLTQHQQICLAEAALIRYFKPYYNDIYKESFPAENQKILASCFDLDFSALITEINVEELGLKLYSENKDTPSTHHSAKYNLVDTEFRRSFFTYVDKDGNEFGLTAENKKV